MHSINWIDQTTELGLYTFAGLTPDPATGGTISPALRLRNLIEEAAAVSWPPLEAMMTRIGSERGWPPMTREQFETSRALRGANFVGTPQEVVEKILFQHEIFGHERFLLQLTVGSLDHAKTMRAIELYGTEVAPAVRAEVARRAAQPTAFPSVAHGASGAPGSRAPR